MPVVIIFLICFVIWYFYTKNPAHGGLVKTKFDYIDKKTAFYGKGKVIAAVIFWLFLLAVGMFQSDAKTTAAILTIVGLVYLGFIVHYFWRQREIRAFKRNAQKLPGKIIGLVTQKRVNDLNSEDRYHFIHYLIVEYVNPNTGEKQEYMPREKVNCSPFYYLKSMDVTVYYQADDRIWVDGFNRIKKLKDNMAYQLTGHADGKDPGVLRYERYEEYVKED